MTLKPLALFLLTSTVVLVSASTSGHAEATVDVVPPLSEQVSVLLRAVRTPEAGATTDNSSAGNDLHVGEGGTAYLTAGDFDAGGRPERALCVGRVGAVAAGTVDPAMTSNAVNVWTVHARVLDATMDGIRLSVDWSRQEAGQRGQLLRAAGDSRTLTLREGEFHTLDFVSADGDFTCGRSMRVDVLAKVKEDPRFADARLGYDLWLLDEAPGSPPLTRHVVLDGRQGNSVDFVFEPLVWPLDGVLLQGAARGQVLARVTGTVRGRLRDDGAVDIVLDAHRTIGVGSGTSRDIGGVADGGRRVLRLHEGETLGVVLPSARGVHTVALDGTWGSVSGAPGMTSPPPPPGAGGAVTTTSESVSVDFGSFFAGHALSLRLTARRQ